MTSIIKKTFIILVTVSLLSGCGIGGRGDLQQYTETRQIFGTYVSINCYYSENKTDIFTTIAKCWARVETIHTEMNARSNVGYIARINESGFYGAEVGSDLFGLLQDSIAYSIETGGAFDVTVFPLVQLWRQAAIEGKVPDKDKVDLARDKVGYRYLSLEEGNIVHLKKKGMKVDAGAIAKGYAVDQFAAILMENGIEHFLIDAGGDIFCKGKDAGKKTWLIGVQDPLKADQLVDTLKLSGGAVTTSGDYERFNIIEGKRYSHIIDPSTGYPENKVISATVIAPTAESADAYATAFSVMGGKEAVSLANKFKNIEAMIIEKKNGDIKRFTTKGYNKHKV
jgi:FAD:protein FMN transferase